MMTMASVFSGIGGEMVAAAMMGWDVKFFCEKNPFGHKVLSHWFDKAEKYEDITTTDFSKWRGKIDVLTGGGSRASLSLTPGSEKARTTTATSGLSCLGASTKSDPLGLWLRTLVASKRWSSPARLLEWQTKPIYSQRITVFLDTNTEAPSPSNESARTLKHMDIPSSRFLFRLVPSEPRTEETECSSSRTETFLKTPCATDSFTDNMKSKGVSGTYMLRQMAIEGLLPTPTAAEGEKGATTYNPKSQMGKSLSAMAGSFLLPTPLAVEREHPDRVAALKATGTTRINSRANGEQRPNGLMDALNFYGMLPTPVTTDAKEAISEEAKRRRIEDGRIGSCLGQLRQMAADGLLPTPQTQGLKVCDENGKTQFLDVGLLLTPRAKGEESYESRAARKGHNVAMTYLESAVEYLTRTNDSEPDMSDPTTKGSRASEGGTHSRLSPLFTEEMMGFPLMWTTLPFLSQNGEQNP